MSMKSESVLHYVASTDIQDNVRVHLDCLSLARLAATCRVGLGVCSRHGKLRCRDLSLTSKTCTVALAAVYMQDIRTLCVEFDGTQGALKAASAALDIPFLRDFELMSHEGYDVDNNEFAPHIALANILSEVVMKPSLRILMVEWPDHEGWDGGRERGECIGVKDSMLHCLLDSFGRSPGLEVIDLTFCPDIEASVGGISALFKGLLLCTTLRDFAYKRAGLRAKHIPIFGPLLKQMTHLSSICLDFNLLFLGTLPAGSQPFLPLSLRFLTLQGLSADNDDDDNAAVGLLLDSIQPLKYLECLSLGQNYWHPHISRLVEVIGGKEHLTWLRLRACALGPDCIDHLRLLICSLMGLEVLDISWNHLGDHVFELARPLSVAPNLRTVYIDLGHQSQEELQAWDEALGCTLVAYNNFRHV